ncbi:MAG TPA: triose-phosphate isomerase [Caulobacteraceae bacterium]|jgi:triosephosphate isomerase|nr:triose-phosphate isomerase [Caulobacteraceae bacterium]
MTAPLLVGNWKMNGLGADLAEARAVAAGVAQGGVLARVALCPAATLVSRMAEALASSKVAVGGQDCRAEASGAFTGDISAAMLTDAGARLVIVGHSERRAGHGETDADVAAKALAAIRAGLEPIICVGETLEQRQAGHALAVVTGQVRGSVPIALAGELANAALAVAYEPIWAIGTGLTPSLAEIEEVHAAIRAALTDIGGEAATAPILYGGSVKPDNAREILHAAEVGGALVGGASLKAADFLKIIAAAG